MEFKNMEDPGTDLKDALEKELREHGVRAPFGLKSKFEQTVLTGISGCAISRSVVGNWVNLPSVRAGEDVTFACAVQRSALCRISPPEGYTIKDLACVRVHAVLNLFGEELP